MCLIFKRWQKPDILQSLTGNSLQEEDTAQPFALVHALQVVTGDAIKEMTRHIHRKVGQLLPELHACRQQLLFYVYVYIYVYVCVYNYVDVYVYVYVYVDVNVNVYVRVRTMSTLFSPSFGLLLHVVSFLPFLSGILWHAAHHNV